MFNTITLPPFNRFVRLVVGWLLVFALLLIGSIRLSGRLGEGITFTLFSLVFVTVVVAFTRMLRANRDRFSIIVFSLMIAVAVFGEIVTVLGFGGWLG